MKERILQFVEYKGFSKRKFYAETGLSNGILDKTSGLSVETLEKIYLTFPEISLEWLITGKGEMLKNEGQITQNGTNNIVQSGKKNNAKIVATEENVNFLREKIAFLKEKEALYKDKIAYLTQEVARLKTSN